MPSMRQLLILFALSAAHTSTKQQSEIGGSGESFVISAPPFSATLDLRLRTVGHIGLRPENSLLLSCRESR